MVDAVSELEGGGVAEPERRMLNAVDEKEKVPRTLVNGISIMLW